MPRSLVLAVVALALAGGIIGWRARRTTDKVLARIAAAPSRPIAGRLATPAADRHRPLANAGGTVALEDLAWLEGAGDRRALAEAEVLAGQHDRALELLDATAPETPAETLIDRAAVELARGHAQAALRLCNRALQKAPQRRGALLWNRALALDGLELPVIAATQFEEVARLGEPGWADEARRRAQALRARHQSYLAGAARAAKETARLRADGTVPPEDVTRGWPDLVRMSLYDAIRGAPSAAAVRALLPLAQRLDGIYGGHTLADRVTRIAARNFAVRGPAAARYRQIAGGASLSSAELAALLATSRNTLADSDDIFLGVEMFVGFPAADAPLYAKIARAQADPWFDALAAESDIRLAYAGDVTRIEPLSRAAIQRCNDAGLQFRCLRITDAFVVWLTEAARVNEAEALASDGRKRAWPRDPTAEANFLDDLAEIERLRNDSDLMGAFLDETLARDPDSCDVLQRVHELKAQLAFRRLQPDVARRELAAVPQKCSPNRYSVMGAIILTNLLHIDGGDADYAAIQEVLRQARRDPGLTPSEKLRLDVYEGRALIERDESAGEAMLRRAIATADARPPEETTTRRLRADAYVRLIVKAAQRARWPQALADVAADLQLPSPPPCTLALLVDDVRAVSVWRDRDGNIAGRLGVRHLPQPARSDVAPDEVVARLRSCPEVRVLALPPLHGRSDLLPPDLAWGYGEGRASAPALAHAPRRLIVTDVRPPEALQLPPLAPRTAAAEPNDLMLRGAAATPERVLAELPDADEALLDVHGLIDLGQSDASMLVLSPDSVGRYALTATAIRKLKLVKAPLVALAACNAAHTAPFLHEAWSLPMAFVDAGARGVLGSSSPVPDRDADRFFDRVLARIHDGQTPAIALRDERQAWLTRGQSWTTDVILFQ